jgi:hypothetical protein
MLSYVPYLVVQEVENFSEKNALLEKIIFFILAESLIHKRVWLRHILLVWFLGDTPTRSLQNSPAIFGDPLDV